MSTNKTMYANATLEADHNLCTLQTCPIDWATIRYVPSLGGNALYLMILAAILLIQIGLGIRYRTWAFLAAFIGGEVLEVIGYVSRVQMHYNPFLANPFLIYLICLTIAPCFLSAGIYLCLSRIIVVYGEHLARFKPKTYTVIFMSCDIFSLVLQAIGGGIADVAKFGTPMQKTGINTMIAGLAFQVISLFVFMALCADFARRVIKHGASGREALRKFGISQAMFKGFMIALALATLAIFIRSCFRVAELHGGFGSALANQQVTFMLLEGMMIVIASIALTIFHPGLIFKGFWKLDKARAELHGVTEIIGGGGKGGILLGERSFGARGDGSL